jgi:hypothetical protein
MRPYKSLVFWFLAELVSSALTSAPFASVLVSSQFSSVLCSTESESHFTTDGQSASLSWHKTPIWGLSPDLYYCLTVRSCFCGRPL